MPIAEELCSKNGQRQVIYIDNDAPESPGAKLLGDSYTLYTDLVPSDDYLFLSAVNAFTDKKTFPFLFI